MPNTCPKPQNPIRNAQRAQTPMPMLCFKVYLGCDNNGLRGQWSCGLDFVFAFQTHMMTLFSYGSSAFGKVSGGDLVNLSTITALSTIWSKQSKLYSVSMCVRRLMMSSGLDPSPCNQLLRVSKVNSDKLCVEARRHTLTWAHGFATSTIWGGVKPWRVLPKHSSTYLVQN